MEPPLYIVPCTALAGSTPLGVDSWGHSEGKARESGSVASNMLRSLEEGATAWHRNGDHVPSLERDDTASPCVVLRSRWLCRE